MENRAKVSLKIFFRFDKISISIDKNPINIEKNKELGENREKTGRKPGESQSYKE